MSFGKVRYFLDDKSNTVLVGVKSVVKHFKISSATVYKLIDSNKLLSIDEKTYNKYINDNKYTIINYAISPTKRNFKHEKTKGDAKKNGRVQSDDIPLCNYITNVGVYNNVAVTTANVLSAKYHLHNNMLLLYIHKHVTRGNVSTKDFIKAKFDYGSRTGARTSYFITLNGVKYLTTHMTCLQTPSAQSITDTLMSDLLAQSKDLNSTTTSIDKHISTHSNVKNYHSVNDEAKNTYANQHITDDFDDLEKCAVFNTLSETQENNTVIPQNNTIVNKDIIKNNNSIIMLQKSLEEMTKKYNDLLLRVERLENTHIVPQEEPIKKFAVKDCMSWTQLSKEINTKSIGLNRNSMLLMLKEAKLINADNQPCNDWKDKSNWFMSSNKKIMGHDYVQTLITPYGIKAISKKLEELTHKQLKKKENHGK